MALSVGDVDVLGDALVGVVVLAGGEQQAVVAGVGHPVAHEPLGEPGAPVDLQPAFDHEVGCGDGHGRGQNEREDGDLDEHAAHGALFQGVVERPVPIVAPHGKRHLPDGEQQQEQGAHPRLNAAFAVPVGSHKTENLPDEPRPALEIIDRRSFRRRIGS